MSTQIELILKTPMAMGVIGEQPLKFLNVTPPTPHGSLEK
jgi:hypothetical protein